MQRNKMQIKPILSARMISCWLLMSWRKLSCPTLPLFWTYFSENGIIFVWMGLSSKLKKCWLLAFHSVVDIWWTESEVDCQLSTMWWKWSLWHWYNLRQGIVDKFTKLSKIGFSIKCFIADFWHNFLAHLSKYALWVAGWVLAINSRDFAKVS